MITTLEDLRNLYAAPKPRALAKQLDKLDPHCRHFISLAPFLVIATTGKDGRVDASPRGGAPGFVRIVDDQIGSPTPAALISTVTGLALAASRRGESLPDGAHLYHLAAANPVSWCGFARAVVEVASRTPGYSSMPAPESIAAIATTDYPLPAPRPANSRFDCSSLEADFRLEMPDWQPYLARMLQLLALKQANGS